MAERLALQRDLLEACDTSPRNHLLAVMLVEGEGLSYEQAAKVSGFTKSTIATYLMHAREAQAHAQGLPMTTALQRQIDQLTTRRASEWLEALKTGDAGQHEAFLLFSVTVMSSEELNWLASLALKVDEIPRRRS